MLYRHMISKTFTGGLVTKTAFLDNSPPYTKLEKQYGVTERKEYASEIVKVFPESVAKLDGVCSLIEKNESIERLFIKNNSVKSLSDVFKDGGSLDSVRSELASLSSSMFSGINPKTGERDVDMSVSHAENIPVVVLTNTFPPQTENGFSYYNPEGNLSVAEFLDSLNSIKLGCSSKECRVTSLDKVSNPDDYFNMGYCSCVDKISSPMFNLYTRRELLEPITRMELAYITVICWSEFKNKFGSVFDNKYEGVAFDWGTANSLLKNFEDGENYKVSKRKHDNNRVLSLDIHDYLCGYGMTDFKSLVLNGEIAIPYPMFMSLLELSQLGVFDFEGNLFPMKQVTRSELATFLVRIANKMEGDAR